MNLDEQYDTNQIEKQAIEKVQYNTEEASLSQSPLLKNKNLDEDLRDLMDQMPSELKENEKEI